MNWKYFGACPFIDYLVLTGAALLVVSYTVTALFAVGTMKVFRLFLGIRTAWDLVTFIAIEHFAQPAEQSKSKVGTDRRTDQSP